MSKRETTPSGLSSPTFAWLGPLSGYAELGTEGYPRAVRRRLTIVNLMAFLIAFFSVVYAVVFAYYDAHAYRHLIVDQSAADGDRALRAACPSHQRHRRGDPDRRRRVYRVVLFRPRFRSRVGHPDQLHHRRGGRLRHLRPVPFPARRRGDRHRPRVAPRDLVPLSAGARAVRPPSPACSPISMSPRPSPPFASSR